MPGTTEDVLGMMCPLPRSHAHMVPDGRAFEFVTKALRASNQDLEHNFVTTGILTGILEEMMLSNYLEFLEKMMVI